MKHHRSLHVELIFEIVPDIDWDISVDSQVFVEVYLYGVPEEALEVFGPFARDTGSDRVWTLAESLEM